MGVRTLCLSLHPLGFGGMGLKSGGLVAARGRNSRSGRDSLDADDSAIHSTGKDLALIGTDGKVEHVTPILILDKLAHERTRVAIPEVDIAKRVGRHDGAVCKGLDRPHFGGRAAAQRLHCHAMG